jgi:TonB family protein
VNHPSSLSGLFAEPRSPRSWAAVATSAALHAVAIAAFLVLAHSAATGSLPRVGRAPLTFVSLTPTPDPARHLHIQSRALRVPPAAIRKTSVPIVELNAPPIEKKMEAPSPVEIKPMPKTTAPEPRPAKPTAVEPPRPAPVVAVVSVGVFASAAPAAHAIEPLRQVQQVGFDAAAAHAPDIAARTSTVGAFDQPAAAARPQPGSDRPNIVADAGFGTAMAAASSRPAARAVSDAGFGGAAGAAAPRTTAMQAVRATEFDAKPAPPAATPAPREARIEIPLEILSKPTPEYTDEARSLKIEGDVLLEVNFSAAGQVHVVRVVRGLGHGLDESAIRAAQGMRFKPALNAGHPTDFKTTVHIVFRLA